MKNAFTKWFVRLEEWRRLRPNAYRYRLLLRRKKGGGIGVPFYDKSSVLIELQYILLNIKYKNSDHLVLLHQHEIPLQYRTRNVIKWAGGL